MTTNVLLCGYGQMGRMLHSLIDDAPDLAVAKIIDVDNVADLESDPKADVVIDFSGPGIFPALSGYVQRTGTALVSGSTGYADHGQALKDLGQYAPVIYTENYSVGVNVMAQVTAELSRLLGDEFDVELVLKITEKFWSNLLLLWLKLLKLSFIP